MARLTPTHTKTAALIGTRLGGADINADVINATGHREAVP